MLYRGLAQSTIDCVLWYRDTTSTFLGHHERDCGSGIGSGTLFMYVCMYILLCVCTWSNASFMTLNRVRSILSFYEYLKELRDKLSYHPAIST